MEVIFGFLIAALIAMTGVGGGTLTVPVLLLFLHTAPAQTVGTALAFAAAVKLMAAPVYMLRSEVNWRILALMLAGGLPGLLGGIWTLHRLAAAQDPRLRLALGLVIISAAAGNLVSLLVKRRGNPRKDRRGWLPALMLPIGAEVGFSSAGGGALGSLALLSCTTLRGAQVVGTDLAFGLVLSLLGGGLQIGLGAYDPVILPRLIAGGIGGAALGTMLASRIPSHALRVGLCMWLAILGAALCWQAVA